MKILGIGKNYVNELSEIEAVKTGLQVLFSKPTSSLVTNNKDVAFPLVPKNFFTKLNWSSKLEKMEKTLTKTML